MLILELASRLKADGAPTISVTSTEGSKEYYKSLGFSDLPVTLMVGFEIDDVIMKAGHSKKILMSHQKRI